MVGQPYYEKSSNFANESPLEAIKYTVAYLEKSSIKDTAFCFHAMIPEKVHKCHCGPVQIFELP